MEHQKNNILNNVQNFLYLFHLNDSFNDSFYFQSQKHKSACSSIMT